jgi:hypothetical protein
LPRPQAYCQGPNCNRGLYACALYSENEGEKKNSESASGSQSLSKFACSALDHDSDADTDSDALKGAEENGKEDFDC